MTVTVPSTVLMFQPILKNSYDQKPGSWHLSFKASIAGTVRSCCGCVMFCDILTSKSFLSITSATSVWRRCYQRWIIDVLTDEPFTLLVYGTGLCSLALYTFSMITTQKAKCQMKNR